MNYKVNENKWDELVYLVNNFYLPIKYTYGKGVYPDRVTFMRSNSAEKLFDPSNDVEFIIFNARSNDTSQPARLQFRKMIESKTANSHFMNEALNFGNKQTQSYVKLFDYIQDKLVNSKTTDFKKLNDFLIKGYKALNPKDALKVAQFREYVLNYCVQENYISNEFANEQISKLPNSLMKLSVGYEK